MQCCIQYSQLTLGTTSFNFSNAIYLYTKHPQPFDGFKHRSGQTKDYKISICCFLTKHTALRRKGLESG